MEIQTENNQPFKTTTRNLSFAETVVINLQLWYEKPCFLHTTIWSVSILH